jgi:hypothetical protein
MMLICSMIPTLIDDAFLLGGDARLVWRWLAAWDAYLLYLMMLIDLVSWWYKPSFMICMEMLNLFMMPTIPDDINLLGDARPSW